LPDLELQQDPKTNVTLEPDQVSDPLKNNSGFTTLPMPALDLLHICNPKWSGFFWGGGAPVLCSVVIFSENAYFRTFWLRGEKNCPQLCQYLVSLLKV
jgi:hypothetical protein